MASLNYKPDGDTLKEFLKNKSFFRGIRGPVGSGKSVACCIEIIKTAINKISIIFKFLLKIDCLLSDFIMDIYCI